MLKLDQVTYFASENRPGGPLSQYVNEDIETGHSADPIGSVSKAGAAAYLVAYALLAGFVGYLFLAI